MSRPIDADKLIRRMQKLATEAWKMGIKCRPELVWNEAIDMVKHAPTVDIQADIDQAYRTGYNRGYDAKTREVGDVCLSDWDFCDEEVEHESKSD